MNTRAVIAGCLLGAMAEAGGTFSLRAAGLEPLLATPHWEFLLDRATGAWAVADHAGGVTWRSNPETARFGEVTLLVAGKPRVLPLRKCAVATQPGRGRLTFHPLAGSPAVVVRVTLAATADGRALDFAWDAPPASGVVSLRLLDHALGGTAAEGTQLIVPVREGMLIPASPGRPFTRRFDTYSYAGCHLAMLGVLRAGATALLTWDDPYVAAEVTRRKGPEGHWRVAPSLVLRETARRFRLSFPGRGDHVTVARAYRRVARRKGWRVSWDEKLKDRPERAKLFGAINFKLWSLLDRRMSEDSQKELSVRVNWTFDEAAQVAEHLHRDLRLERVLFLMGGWIHRGYDNQHPDILPAAPECGGNAGLTDCARRVRALGYLFGLHDNYQDIYRDSPSWDEALIMRRHDGSLARGGRWAGGRAYLTCSPKALELARRPQNLPAVHDLTHADAYFIDTTYAAGLQECFSPEHPLKRADDLRWKQALSDYARGMFGVFGSEDGREWAIPHADFFEGLAGVSGREYHNAKLLAEVGGVPIPFFELVYHDTIACYGKYGYDPGQAGGYLLRHALYGRTLHHHDVPAHRYWQKPFLRETSLRVWPLPPRVKSLGPRTLRFTWRWQVEAAPQGDWRVFVHFTDVGGNIQFQADHRPATPTHLWRPGEVVSGQTQVRVPDGAKGAYDVRVGLFAAESLGRARLACADDGDRRVVVGRLICGRAGARFAAAPPPAIRQPGGPDPGCFTRGDGGWTEGLHPYDRFVKNSYELLSPLNELTARLPMARHAFLTEDRRAQQTVFGAGTNRVTVTVNFGPQPYETRSALGGAVRLPPFGLLIEGPAFVAFHALSWNGHRYAEPALFTLRSLDGQPLAASRRMRVYHGFGPSELALGGGRVISVRREATVERRGK